MRGSLRKRGDRYYAVYRDETGKQKWEAAGTNEKNARKLLRSRVEAIDNAKALERAERRQGTYQEPTEQTFGDYLDDWLKRKKARLAPSTHRTYDCYAQRELKPRLGQRPIVSLAPHDFDRLAGELEQANRAARTVRQIVAIARSALSDAVRLGIVTTNPASRVDMPLPEPTAGKEIPAGDLTKIRTALAELAPPDPLRPGELDMLAPLAFDIALALGVRWSELAGLRWRAVNFQARQVLIEEAIVLGQPKRPKSGRSRTVPMFDTAHTARGSLASRALDRGRYGPAEYVLAGPRGNPPDPSNWRERVWRPALHEAGLDGNGYRWHDLRHSTVSRLIAQGADIALVQAVAGHASAATTLKIYQPCAPALANSLESATTQRTPAAERMPASS